MSVRLGVLRSFFSYLSVLLFACVFVGLSSSVHAQDTPASTLNSPTPNTMSGTPPFSSIEQTAHEQISLASGSLSFSVSILALPQKGGRTLNIGFVYSSNSWAPKETTVNYAQYNPDSNQPQIDYFLEHDATVQWVQNQVGPWTSALHVNLPTLNADLTYTGVNKQPNGAVSTDSSAYCLQNWIFTDWEGNAHSFKGFRDCGTDISYMQPYSYYTLNVRDATDGSGYQIDARNASDIVVRGPDGTAYHFPPHAQIFQTTGATDRTALNFYAVAFSSIVDPNGNVVTNTYQNGVYTITDTAGRQITVGGGNGLGTSISWSQQTSPGQSPTTQTVAPSVQYSSNMVPLPNANSDACTAKPNNLYIQNYYGAQITIDPPPSVNAQAVWTIPLLDGSSYQLTLNALNQLVEIKYPTGGYTRYDFAQFSSGQHDVGDMMCPNYWNSVIAKHECTLASGSCTQSQPITNPQNCVPGESGGEATTCYSGNPGQYNWGELDVTDPQNNKTAYSFLSYAGPTSDGNYVTPMETDHQTYSSSGSLLQSVHTDYTDSSNNWCAYAGPVGTDYYGPIPCKTTTTLNDVSPALSKSESFVYWMPGMLQSSSETDFSGNILRSTSNVYETGGIYTDDNESATSTTLTHVVDHVQSHTVNETATNKSLTTTYTYDSVGNLQQVDMSATGAATETSVIHRNSTGDIIQKQDPMQVSGAHPGSTTFGYTNQNISGCPTNDNMGLPTLVTNALGHMVKTAYYPTGLVACVQDANGNITRTSYDVLSRPSEIDLPDGGQTNYQYTSSTPLTMTQTTKMSSNESTGHQYLLDGFGRSIQSILTTAPEGPICTETFYDALGRVSAMNDPHVSCPAPSTPIAGASVSFTYDALNRKTVRTNEDGTTQQWRYSGSTTVFTGEAGNQWQQTGDALGRLVQVLEPTVTEANIGTGTPETDYTYDGFGNLWTVTQKGIGGETVRTRSFTYDGFSRLLTAVNPETGTICYGVWSGTNCVNGYDGNGNLVARTDARGTTTTYTYDALNRLTGKTFSDGMTPAQYFHYDQTSGWAGAQPNTIGRLSEAGTTQDMRYFGTGAAPACNPQTSATANYNPSNGNPVYCNWTDELYSYDAMGRLNRLDTALPSEAGWAAHRTAMEYNQAGNMTKLTYPDQRVVTQGYDSAGRLQSVTFDNWNGTHIGYNYLTMDPITPYFPDGSPEKMTFGNGAIQTLSKNNRLQPTEIDLQSNASGLVKQSVFDRQYNYTSSCQSANNGNIQQIIDPLNNGNSQGFCYDALNRIISFSNGSGTMQQSYAYDSFGNLKQNGTLNFLPSYDTNNRINSNGYIYDAAGNLNSVNNGVTTSTYAFDAESKPFLVNSSAYYSYDAAGERIRKDVGGSYTEYQYLTGQPIAEKDPSGNWTDYIYANGQRIAMANSFDVRIHTHGTFDATGEAAVWTLPLTGYVVKSDDHICWRQSESEPGGGLGVNFTNGTSTGWVAYDQGGNLTNSDNAPWGWHNRCVDLKPDAGLTLAGVWIGANDNAAAGTWDILFGDITITSTDGTVTPLYWRDSSAGLSSPWTNNAGPTNLQAYVETTNASLDMLQPDATTTYYQADQIGSARMLTSAGGWPVKSYTFYPFGQDATPSADPNHYKFTGKERDSESGLDYFGARYYASSMGRWMSPDWAEKPEAVPYSSLDNPQSLNLYGYVLNNPLSQADPDGHCCWDEAKQWISDHPRTSQAVGGVGKIAVGVGLVGTIAGGDVPGSVVGAGLVVSGTLSAVASVVSGVTDVTGAATNTNVQGAQKGLDSVSNVPALVTTAATGNPKAGAAVGTLSDAAQLAVKPQEALKNPATMADAAKTLSSTVDLGKSAASAMQSSRPPAPPPPPPPSCSVAGACK